MTEETGLDEIRRARHDLDAVIEEIRQQPGYADFLAAPTFDDISEAAQEYPLVYLAAAEPGGLALIVRGTNVEHVPLDGLTTEPLRDQVATHFAVYEEYATDREPTGRRGWRRWTK